MHGYDWEALREQYKPLLEHVAHRTDLNYVISEMISELTVQHAYIDGGDIPTPPRPRVALPGARFELDKAVRTVTRSRGSSRARTRRTFTGRRSPRSAWTRRSAITCLRSTAQELTGKDDPYRLLRNAADNPVALMLNSKPDDGGRARRFLPADHGRERS